MKKVLLAVLCLSLLFTIGVKASSIGDVFMIHKTATPPVIDGIMEDLWKTASTELVVNVDVEDAAPPDSYNDMFATVRALWDDSTLYFFLQATDNVVLTDLGNRYENDSFEIMLDGGNEKADAYDSNDLQFRIQYGDTEILASDFNTNSAWTAPATNEGTAMAIEDWAYPELAEGESPMGWNLEIQWPLIVESDDGGVIIDAEVGSVFGFEVQLNENDGAGSRENMLRWWGNSNNAWNTPSLYGTAELAGYLANTEMKVPKIDTAPTIDGSDADWDGMSVYVPEIHMSCYVDHNGETVPDGFAELDDWKDLEMKFRMAWDDDNLYFFADIIDEAHVADLSGTSHEQDGIEICIDGNNDKTVGAYDDNDKQYRWVLNSSEITAGVADAGTWAWAETDSSYQFELQLASSDLLFILEDGATIGLEVQVNDNDGQTSPARENMARWWGNDNMTWTDASLMGTATLVESVNAIDLSEVVKVNRFKLSQNFPNPFNPSTSIAYSIEKAGAVRLTVFDMLGHEVATLVNEVKTPGSYTATFDGTDLTSGIYFYRLEAGAKTSTNKMMLMK